ncbi:MAG TPA: M48 family peptidase [bacterium]|nr:M48 family peptidase [bacterium]
MKTLMIFGKDSEIITEKSDRDSLEFRDNKVFITYEKAPENLLKDFLAELLYTQVCEIYEEIRKEGKIDIFGNLDFEIVEKIDGKNQRIAKLKGNKIFIKLNAVALPKGALKYIIAHEIAHTLTKKHTKKFWKIVEAIYPGFREGERDFMEYGKVVVEFADNYKILFPHREE